MIYKHPMDLSLKRAYSPLSRVDLNLPQKTHTQYVLKSPPPQDPHRLKRMQTYSENTSMQLSNLSFKENRAPQSRPRLMFSNRSNQVQHSTPSVKFSIVASSASNVPPAPQTSLSIQPFSLVMERDHPMERLSELC